MPEVSREITRLQSGLSVVNKRAQANAGASWPSDSLRSPDPAGMVTEANYLVADLCPLRPNLKTMWRDNGVDMTTLRDEQALAQRAEPLSGLWGDGVGGGPCRDAIGGELPGFVVQRRNVVILEVDAAAAGQKPSSADSDGALGWIGDKIDALRSDLTRSAEIANAIG